MGIAFFESMRGELTDHQGNVRVADFAVKAEASHARHFLRSGRARLTGAVTIPPWAHSVPAEGSIEIGLRHGGRISYDLTFRDDDEHPCRLSGEKAIHWLRPVRSMTHMEARLERDAVEIANGELRFDLNELVHFAASWVPRASFAVAPSVPRRVPPLDERSIATVRALAEVWVEPGVAVPPVDEESMHDALENLGQMPPYIVRLYRATLVWLDAEARLTHGRRFSRLDRAARRQIVERLGSGRATMPLLPRVRPRRVLQLLCMPLAAAHFDRPEYLDRIGFPMPTPVRAERPRYFEQVIEAEALAGETTVEADVVVVGTGAGGAVIAAECAEAGLGVAIIEEGRYLQRDAFNTSPVRRTHGFWRNAGMSFSVGRPPISIPLGKLVGGTTAINSGTCLRAPAEVLDSWRRELGFPDDFAPDNFRTYYDRVAQELGVGADPAVVGRVAGVIGRGADAMGLAHAPLPRNAPGCDGQGTCIFGCPTDAKRSTNISYVPRALQAGAALYVGLPVTRLLMRGPHAVAIEARGADRLGAPHTLRVVARAVVIACGAIGTPPLLINNGFRLPALGRNLSLHPSMGMWAMCPEDLEPWRAVPQGLGVSGHGREELCFEGFYLPPQLAAAAMPLVGRELTRWMDAHRRVAQFGFMIRDRGRGTVRPTSWGSPLVRYDLAPQSVRLLGQGAAMLAELMLRGGADEVLTGIEGIPPLRTVEQARALAGRSLETMDFNLLGAHPLGTCRVGADAERGAVDFDHRLFGTDNVYVVDGSSVPTSLGVNPQMTIMAMATRAAERLTATLS